MDFRIPTAFSMLINDAYSSQQGHGHRQMPTGNYVYTHPNPNRPPPPPQQAQQFGHGAPADYFFQYSACTGRRKALLVGINYHGQNGELHGCINDVVNVSTYLNKYFNYEWEDMRILRDDKEDPVYRPTKANILREMQWLVDDAQPNDSLFFHYSGTGHYFSKSICLPLLTRQPRTRRSNQGSEW
jgi:hypothetical protein